MKTMEDSKEDAKTEAELNSNVHLHELKRVQSVKQMIKSYREQRNTIKAALDNLDRKPNKKIIFNEDNEPSTSNVAIKENGKKGKALFHSDDEDEDFNFEMKNQFDGREGQQLYKLQSKYKGDKRFKLNERFLESNDEIFEDEPTATEFSIDEEKKNEINILEQVLGTKMKSDNLNLQRESSHTKKMLRFDPTQSDHLQYEISTNNTVKNKKIKKKHNEVNEDELNQQPHVSKDVFYKVSNDLRDTFQTQQEFKLLNSFNNTEKEDDEEMEEQAVEIENRGKLLSDKNPFHYDSSDDELENHKEKKEPIQSHRESSLQFVSEPFFFKDDDFRLQEGSDFVKRIASEINTEFGQQRTNLKNVVKAKVRNNQRKDKPFKKKLGGNKKRKVGRIKKALQR